MFANVHISYCAAAAAVAAAVVLDVGTLFSLVSLTSQRWETFYKLMSNKVYATQKPMTTSDSRSHKYRVKASRSIKEMELYAHTHTIYSKKKQKYRVKYLHATSMVADWLFAFPRGDHAWQSHLNGDLPKYSYTKSLDIVAVTSCNWTPVCGSTCESNVDGGGCELPLHLNVS